MLYSNQHNGAGGGLASLSELIKSHWQKLAEKITNAIVQELRQAKGAEANESEEFSLLVLKQK